MKFNQKLISTLVVLAFWLMRTFGQQYQAVHGSNYAGSLGVMNNPASALSSPLPWDVTLLGLQLKNSTNFFYIEKYDPTGKNPQLAAWLQNGEYKRRLNTQFNMNLLNARFRTSNRSAVSFGMNVRSASLGGSSTYNFIDTILEPNTFLKVNMNNQPLDAFVRSSTWAEAYGSLALNLADKKHFIWNAGVTIKSNMGLAGIHASITNGQFKEYVRPVYNLYEVTTADLNYGYSANLDFWDPAASTNSNLKRYFNQSRRGGSIDLGMEWIIKDQQQIELFNNKSQYNYTWKLGISLLDLGYAKYSYGLESVSTSGVKPNINGIALARKFDSTIIGLDVLNDSIQTAVGQFNTLTGDFMISHPTRLVFNVDRQITDLIYINAELSIPIQALPAATYMQTRDFNLLTITPRRETQKYGVYLPLSITREGSFWIGAAVKAGPVLFGFHRVPIGTKTSYQNGGAYLAYTISPSEKLRKPKGKIIKCPK
jgi:hypothetical protein